MSVWAFYENICSLIMMNGPGQPYPASVRCKQYEPSSSANHRAKWITSVENMKRWLLLAVLCMYGNDIIMCDLAWTPYLPPPWLSVGEVVGGESVPEATDKVISRKLFHSCRTMTVIPIWFHVIYLLGSLVKCGVAYTIMFCVCGMCCSVCVCVCVCVHASICL